MSIFQYKKDQTRFPVKITLHTRRELAPEQEPSLVPM